MEHAAVHAGHLAFERHGALGRICLTRPDALNALTHDMVRAMRARLDEWAADDAVASVCITGEGRAFSAGGDIRAIYEKGRAGEPFDEFFADEYALNIQIKGFPKPYVALIDGIAMGGGVGVSYHGSHVVVGENARFAMPECGIGFFPDVGGTFLLGHLPEPWGPALGLSGARLGAAEQVALGLATHALRSEDWPRLMTSMADGADPDEALGQMEQDDADPAGTSDVEPPPGWNQLRHQSPTSFRVAERQIAMGATRSFEQCMGIEARIVHRMLRGHDFYEGIRAAVIDKADTRAWSPATLYEVSEADIERHFDPVESGPLASLSALAD